MRPLMELSASLDTYRPNSAALFRAASAGSKAELILNEGKWECRVCLLEERAIVRQRWKLQVEKSTAGAVLK